MTTKKNADAVLAAIKETIAGYDGPSQTGEPGALAPSAQILPTAPVPEQIIATRSSETNLLYKMPPEVVAKMQWVIDNVPKMNKQKIVREAVNTYLDAVISAHRKA